MPGQALQEAPTAQGDSSDMLSVMSGEYQLIECRNDTQVTQVQYFRSPGRTSTRNTTSGALLAGVEDDDEVVKWRSSIDPQLLQTLAVSPVSPVRCAG